MENNELTSYINEAIGRLVSNAIKNTLNNPKETLFLMQYRKQSEKALKTRTMLESKGQHIPAFMISSITNACNLFCKGCYARNNGICGGEETRKILTDEKWADIFKQASDLGIGFHLLAGGEPLLRRDVILKAAALHDTVFPIFTNGTMIDEMYCEIFDKNRNLIPVISMEGSQMTTDYRRGHGVYKQLKDKMQMLKALKILFGVSITVTKENLNEVTGEEFIGQLEYTGCGVVFFIEYVPIDEATNELALSDSERGELAEKQTMLRERFKSILFLSFPGDERNMGGCLAAGRGFFHINPYGDAEACPFSPYSDCSLKDRTLADALKSNFFKRLQEERLVGGEHSGGCALFEKKDSVEALLDETKEQNKNKGL